MKINKIIIFSAIIFLCQGCVGFLQEKNPVGRTDIYLTENDLEAAVEGVLYGFAYGNGITGESNEAFPIASGLIHWGRSNNRLNSNKWLSAIRFTQYASNDWNGKYFRSVYTPVFRANALIAGLKTSPVDEEYKLEIEAEARLLRAVAYFTAVRVWGDVPLRLEEVSLENCSAKPRAPYYEVYTQIVRDLEFAETYMRSPSRANEIAAGIVRPNKFAATAYLSSVYTTIGSLLDAKDDNFWNPQIEGRSPDFSSLEIHSASDAYGKALEYAEMLLPESDVADSDCEYRLLTKFGDLFLYDNSFARDGYTSWRHPEQVLVFPVSVEGDPNSSYANYQLPPYPAGTSATIYGEQWGRVRPTRWAFQEWCKAYPGELRSKSSTDYISSADPRLEDTFYYNYMDFCFGQVYDKNTYIDMYPQTLKQGNKHAFPYFKKYASPTYNVNTGDADIYMMRFAEVYFNAIEAAAYLGEEQKARKYMDVVHARARRSVPDGQADSEDPSWNGLTFNSKDEMMTRIFWERIFEFFGENKEYYETHRHGAQWIVDNIAKPKNAFLKKSEQDNLVGYYYPLSTDGEKVYSESVEDARKGLLAGFPVEEVLYNSLIQNNGRNDFDFGL